MSFLGTLIGGGIGFLAGGPMGAAIGASMGSGVDSSKAAAKAAGIQSDAANRAADLQYKQWRESVDLQEPWRKAGEQALNQLVPLATNYTPFSMDQFQQDPGYAFRLSEGQKALERSAAARAGLQSGSALKAAARFGQEMGSQEYQNAFNRYQAERQARLGPLQSLAGVGQTTATQLGQSGQQMAGNVGDLMTSGAAARASGYVGGANALSSALGQGMNYYQGNQMLNMLGNRAGYGTSYAAPTTDYSSGANYALSGELGVR